MKFVTVVLKAVSSFSSGRYEFLLEARFLCTTQLLS